MSITDEAIPKSQMTMTIEEQVKKMFEEYRDNPNSLYSDKKRFFEDYAMSLIKTAQYEYAEEICRWIDDIELSYKETSLEEWKAFKDIRNIIRQRNEERRGK